MLLALRKLKIHPLTDCKCLPFISYLCWSICLTTVAANPVNINNHFGRMSLPQLLCLQVLLVSLHCLSRNTRDGLAFGKAALTSVILSKHLFKVPSIGSGPLFRRLLLMVGECSGSSSSSYLGHCLEHRWLLWLVAKGVSILQGFFLQETYSVLLSLG